MSVVIEIVFKAKDDRFQALRDLMVEILPDTARYAGAELVSCSADPETRTVFLHEVWDRIESQQAYFAWRTEAGDIERIVANLREPPEVSQRDHVAF